MYTIRGKANDRFGTETGGSFRVPYASDRIVITAGLIVLGISGALVLWQLYAIYDISVNTGSNISHYMNDLIYGGLTEKSAMGDLFRLAATVQGLAFGVGIFLILAVIFIIISRKLCIGKTCRFQANEELFVVIFPGKTDRAVGIFYDDVIGIEWKVRKFPFTGMRCDVTVRSRDKTQVFTALIPKSAQDDGITETPYNIIREMTGLAEKDERYLINRGIK